MISRRAFLEWLREATDSRTVVRGVEGNHFYGRVHLLVYGQAGGQTWSHLILTGQNEGVWPRLFEAGAFLSRYELAQLNGQAKQLNKNAREQGSQGEGHQTVAAGKGYCLLPLDRPGTGTYRDLCLALEGTRGAACFRGDDDGGGAEPVAFGFPESHAWQSKTGQVMDESVFRALATETDVWCEEQGKLLESESDCFGTRDRRRR